MTVRTKETSAMRDHQIQTILFNLRAAAEQLRALNVHGALGSDGEYLGYDYVAQKWVDTKSA